MRASGRVFPLLMGDKCRGLAQATFGHAQAALWPMIIAPRPSLSSFNRDHQTHVSHDRHPAYVGAGQTTGRLRNSTMVQRWDVSPAAIAGVRCCQRS
jgi:hypothetical protein